MTRVTPELLKARSSNLSLHTLAMEQSRSMAMRMNSAAEVIDNKMDAKDLKPEAFTKAYLEFMTENPTVFHAVDYFKEKLLKAGYKEVGVRISGLQGIGPVRPQLAN
jgi:aminopeptidase I